MDTKILLSASWVVVTLIYLYDDVLRICSGDFAKSMANMSFNHGHLVGNCHLDAHPNFDGIPHPGPAPTGEPLGEYHRGRLLLSIQFGWPAHLSLII